MEKYPSTEETKTSLPFTPCLTISLHATYRNFMSVGGPQVAGGLPER